MNKLSIVYILFFQLLLTWTPFTTIANVSATEKRSDFDAVLFYKNDCGDCELLMREILPGILKKNEKERRFLGVNNSTSLGGQLFLDALFNLGLSTDLQLPILIVGDKHFGGSQSISENLELILSVFSEANMEIKWQTVNQELAKNEEIPINDYYASLSWIVPSSKSPREGVISGFKRQFIKDPVANSLAVLVLFLLIASLLISFGLFITSEGQSESPLPWIFPILVICGIFISFYLFYSGLTESALTCGPVGECNEVQQSEYAKLFGIIPVSLLGLVTYVLCFFCWIGSKLKNEKFRNYSIVAVWLLMVGSVLFFTYLTFLEPFVLGATCIWCLSAATITLILALVSALPAKAAFQSIRARI